MLSWRSRCGWFSTTDATGLGFPTNPIAASAAVLGGSQKFKSSECGINFLFSFLCCKKHAWICNSMFQDPKLSFKSVQILLFIIWRIITTFNCPFGTRSGPVATWTYQPKLQMNQKRHGSMHATFHAVHPLQKWGIWCLELFGGVLIVWIAELLACPAPPPGHHPPILRTIKFLTAATSLKADYSSYSSCGHGRKFYCVLAETFRFFDLHAWHVFHHISLCNASCKMATWMPHGKFCGESWSSSTSHLPCITSRSINTIQCRKLSSKPDPLEIPFDMRTIHDNRISTIWSRTVRPICGADALKFLNPSSKFWNGSQSLFKWSRPASQMRILVGKEIDWKQAMLQAHVFIFFQGWKHPKHEDPFSNRRSASWGDMRHGDLSHSKGGHLLIKLWTCSATENLTPAHIDWVFQSDIYIYIYIDANKFHKNVAPNIDIWEMKPKRIFGPSVVNQWSSCQFL